VASLSGEWVIQDSITLQVETKMLKTATTHMKLSKLTKGAVQYKEEDMDDDPMYLIGTLYLRKAGLVHEQLTADHSREYPARIKVTIEVVE